MAWWGGSDGAHPIIEFRPREEETAPFAVDRDLDCARKRVDPVFGHLRYSAAPSTSSHYSGWLLAGSSSRTTVRNKSSNSSAN
jgi:hypothetical protein